MFNKTPFGSTSGMFGQSLTGFSGFGSSQPQNTSSGFGNTSGFGQRPQLQQQQQPTSVFGGFGQQQQQTTSGFGQAANTGGFSAFGSSQPTQSMTSGFGQSSMSSGSLFGSTKPTAFGSSSTSSFGSGSTFGSTTSAFGSQPTSGFRSSLTGPTLGAFGAKPTQCPSSANVKFQPLIGTESMSRNGSTQSITTRLHNISAMPQFSSFSPEEIRLADYQCGAHKARQAGTSTGFGGFGQSNSAFGQTAQQSTFGAVQPKPSFGFGSTSTSTPSSGLFGSTSSGFGGLGQTQQQQQPSTGFGGFGGAKSTGTTGSLFGSTQAAKPAFGFGSTPTSSSSGFGSTGFGSTLGSSSSGFGGFGQQQQQQAQPTTSLFGSTKPAFGGFGSQQTTQASMGFGSSLSKTTSTPSFGGFGGLGSSSAPTSSAAGSSLFPSFGKPATSTPTLGFGQSGFGGGTSTFGATSGTLGASSTSFFGSQQQQQPGQQPQAQRSFGFGLGLGQQQQQQQPAPQFQQQQQKSAFGFNFQQPQQQTLQALPQQQQQQQRVFGQPQLPISSSSAVAQSNGRAFEAGISNPKAVELYHNVKRNPRVYDGGPLAGGIVSVSDLGEKAGKIRLSVGGEEEKTAAVTEEPGSFWGNNVMDDKMKMSFAEGESDTSETGNAPGEAERGFMELGDMKSEVSVIELREFAGTPNLMSLPEHVLRFGLVEDDSDLADKSNVSSKSGVSDSKKEDDTFDIFADFSFDDSSDCGSGKKTSTPIRNVYPSLESAFADVSAIQSKFSFSPERTQTSPTRRNSGGRKNANRSASLNKEETLQFDLCDAEESEYLTPDTASPSPVKSEESPKEYRSRDCFDISVDETRELFAQKIICTKEGWSYDGKSVMIKDDYKAFIEDFTVIREGVGKIVFPGWTRVMRLNIDRDVILEKDFVGIYVERNGMPTGYHPEIGEGLNKKAYISLFFEDFQNINEEDLIPKQKQELLAKVGTFVIVKLGAEYIDYDFETATVEFRINSWVPRR